MRQFPGEVEIWICSTCGETFGELLQSCPNCFGLFGESSDCDTSDSENYIVPDCV